MAQTKNKITSNNKKVLKDRPLLSLSEINIQPSFKDFNDCIKNIFTKLCKWKPDMSTGKFEIIEKNNRIDSLTGMVYMLTIDDKIISISYTGRTFAKITNSYNTANHSCQNSNVRGAVTNWFIRESIIGLNKEVTIYYIEKEPSEDLRMKRNSIIKKFVDTYDKKPIALAQKKQLKK